MDRKTCIRGDANHKYDSTGWSSFLKMSLLPPFFYQSRVNTLVADGRRDRLTTWIADTGGSSRRVRTH